MLRGGGGASDRETESDRRSQLENAFVKEIRTLTHLRHPNIISIMGAVVGDGEPLMIMELMELGRYVLEIRLYHMGSLGLLT